MVVVLICRLGGKFVRVGVGRCRVVYRCDKKIYETGFGNLGRTSERRGV